MKYSSVTALLSSLLAASVTCATLRQYQQESLELGVGANTAPKTPLARTMRQLPNVELGGEDPLLLAPRVDRIERNIVARMGHVWRLYSVDPATQLTIQREFEIFGSAYLDALRFAYDAIDHVIDREGIGDLLDTYDGTYMSCITRLALAEESLKSGDATAALELLNQQANAEDYFGAATRNGTSIGAGWHLMTGLAHARLNDREAAIKQFRQVMDAPGMTAQDESARSQAEAAVAALEVAEIVKGKRQDTQ